jgi:uncharacterized membrane protein YfcA
VLGAILGAYILSSFPGDAIKPWIAVYLLIMGVVILVKAVRKAHQTPKHTRLGPLGFIGGFVDSVGGGGWGPVVTSTLVARGNSPRFVIGSVNVAEFFVAAASSATFFLTLGSVHVTAIVGLVVGGMVAAPIAAIACKRVQPKPLMLAVGVLIIGLSLRTIAQASGPLGAVKTAVVAATSHIPWQ